MKFLTIEYIKAHSRIDCDCEDDLIDLYGSAAEETVINMLNRTLDDLKEANGGTVPAAVMQAALLIADNSYHHRTPSEPNNRSLVPYSVDCLLMPYVVL